jgi:phosphoribosylanthranilate isomerase
MIVKVCGMRDGDNIRQVAALGVDWIGMIFWEKSPRNVTMIPTNAGIIPDKAPSNFSEGRLASSLTGDGRRPLFVGVFVDEMAQNIVTRVVNFHLDIVQFHGHETPTLIRNLRRTLDPDIRPGVKFIKAISVECREDLATYKDYADCVDYFLFDTKCQSVGGSGRQFDWSILDAYDGDLPFLISGGIGPDDADRVRAFFSEGSCPAAAKCIGIDLNSRFETEPGVKDVAALRDFLGKL